MASYDVFVAAPGVGPAMGPFEDWEYMTSGMHAILAFSRMCETLDVYGFTTDVSAGPYWFTGRKAGFEP
jgi:hypothetical protein